MTNKEAIKRLRQETCPNTYMPDFDKEECLQVIEKDLKPLEILKPLCSIHKTPKMNYMYLRVGGVVVKKLNEEEYNLFEEWLKNDINN